MFTKFFIVFLCFLVTLWSNGCKSSLTEATSRATTAPTPNPIVQAIHAVPGSLLTFLVNPPVQDIPVGAPAIIQIELKNTGFQRLLIETGSTPSGCWIFRATRNGLPLDYSESGRELMAQNISVSSMITSFPINYKFASSVDISKLFDMSVIGKYKFNVTRTVWTSDGGKITVYAPRADATVIVSNKKSK